jgi:hypothetical protein
VLQKKKKKKKKKKKYGNYSLGFMCNMKLSAHLLKTLVVGTCVWDNIKVDLKN